MDETKKKNTHSRNWYRTKEEEKKNLNWKITNFGWGNWEVCRQTKEETEVGKKPNIVRFISTSIIMAVPHAFYSLSTLIMFLLSISTHAYTLTLHKWWIITHQKYEPLQEKKTSLWIFLIKWTRLFVLQYKKYTKKQRRAVIYLEMATNYTSRKKKRPRVENRHWNVPHSIGIHIIWVIFSKNYSKISSKWPTPNRTINESVSALIYGFRHLVQCSSLSNASFNTAQIIQ